jgi:hypothetical protein
MTAHHAPPPAIRRPAPPRSLRSLLPVPALVGSTVTVIVPYPERRHAQLVTETGRILWDGIAGPGQLKILTFDPVPVPIPVMEERPLIGVTGFFGQEGALRHVFVVGEPLRIQGWGFGAIRGQLFVNGFLRPVVTWSDTEIVTSYDDSNRSHPIWLTIRRADGKSRTLRSPNFPLVMRPDLLPAARP